MPSPNIEVVRRALVAWDRKDLDAMLQEYDPDVEVVDPERAGPGPLLTRLRDGKVVLYRPTPIAPTRWRPPASRTGTGGAR